MVVVVVVVVVLVVVVLVTIVGVLWSLESYLRPVASILPSS